MNPPTITPVKKQKTEGRPIRFTTPVRERTPMVCPNAPMANRRATYIEVVRSPVKLDE